MTAAGIGGGSTKICAVPFTCEACGGRSDLLPAVDDGAALGCPRCDDRRPFVRPPLLVVTGTCGVGKSTLCARLAGTIGGALLLDADVHAEDLVSVVPPNQDYEAFWRSMLRLAHELSQNGVAVVYFSTMLPQQLLSSTDLLGYFSCVRFLCLTCPPDALRSRLERRVGRGLAGSDVNRWIDFDRSLVASAGALPAAATVLDASGSPASLEAAVREWIERALSSR